MNDRRRRARGDGPAGPERRPAATAARGERRRGCALAVGIAALAVLPYLNSLTAGFTLDDVPRIVANPMVRGEAPALGLLTWVDRPEIYRPLTMLTFAGNARLGTSAAGFHVVNVLLHALVTVAALALARLVLPPPGAAAAAALFAVHPIHTEAVTNVFGRSELLAALFVLVCLLALARASRPGTPGGGRRRWFGLSVIAFAAGMLSKESAVVAVALCGAVHLWVARDRRVTRLLRAMAPYLVVAVVYLVWRRYLVGALGMPVPPDFQDNPLAHAPLVPRLATAAVVVGQYLGLLTFPLTLSSDYSFNQVPVVSSILDPRLLGAAAGVAAPTVAIVVGLRRAPALAAAATIFLVPLATTANVFVVIGTIKAERLLYLPSLGWCLAVGWLVAWAAARRRPLAIGALGIVLCAFAARTWVRNDDWRDDVTAHAVAARTAPDSAKAHYNRARDLISERRLDEAIRHLRRSLAIYPASAQAEANLGGALALAGDLTEAAEHLVRAARLDPDSAIVRANLSQVYARQGRLDEALEQLETAVRLDPRLPGASETLQRLRAAGRR